MKTYTDGTVTIKVGTRYAHLYNKAGSKIGRADMRDGSFKGHMIAAGFEEVQGEEGCAAFNSGSMQAMMDACPKCAGNNCPMAGADWPDGAL